jgi:hypothetical protein
MSELAEAILNFIEQDGDQSVDKGEIMDAFPAENDETLTDAIIELLQAGRITHTPPTEPEAYGVFTYVPQD